MADRALIAGGAGFIGLHLARELCERGREVTIVDNFFRARADAELRDLLREVELVEHDLTQPLPESLDRGYAEVYHLAAVVGVQRSGEVPQEVLRINLRAALNVFDWCASHAPERVFLASTSEVADAGAKLGLGAVPVSEAAPVAIADVMLPRASYAVSKLAGEVLLINYARAYGFAARIARYHNVYGPRMGHDHVIPQLIDRVLDGRDPFPIFGAHQTRAFCHVRDAVDATVALMELATPEPLLVNVGNDREEIAILDLVERLFAIADVSPEIAIEAPPPGSPDRRRPNLDLLRRLTAFEPTVSLHEGLVDTYRWYLADRRRAGGLAKTPRAA